MHFEYCNQCLKMFKTVYCNIIHDIQFNRISKQKIRKYEIKRKSILTKTEKWERKNH